MQGLESLNQFQNFVSSIGGLGRFEDTYIVHAAEGETVVPMEVLDKNPLLKKRLFKSMIDMGIEPGRYIVGNELNSKNPVTGQPEFFLKKVVDRLKKAAADVSGYAAPIVGAMYGPAAGAAVGAGLGAFKRENPGDPSQWAQMAMLGGGSGIASNILGGGGAGTNWLTGKGLSGRYNTMNPLTIGKSMLGMEGGLDPVKDNKGILDRFLQKGGEKDYLTTLDELSSDPENLRKLKSGEIDMDDIRYQAKQVSSAKNAVLGGMDLKDAAVLYGLGTAGLGLLIDMTSSDEDAGTRADPYVPHGLDYGWTTPTIDYGYNIPIAAAKGGVMDLRSGGESAGPGTGTSDSIPAMLSDGEFVMTAKAVRGAGGGNRREGARKMYEAMDRLEARA